MLSEEQEWQEGFRLGREQGLREAQALAVAFLRERACKLTPLDDGASVLEASADKLEDMKFLAVSTAEPTVMTPDRSADMPGYATHVLNQYLAETRGVQTGPIQPKDALDQYQMEMLRYWCSHLEHVLLTKVNEQIISFQDCEAIIREFIYGAVPHPHDAMERERLRTIAHDAIATTTRPHFTP